MARVVYRDENYQTFYVDVNAQQTEVTIGRNPGNKVLIPTKSLSRYHAKIIYQNGRYFLYDLKSSNGTYVNNTRINQQEIRPGDKLRFGDVNVDFIDETRMNAPSVSQKAPSMGGMPQAPSMGGMPQAPGMMHSGNRPVAPMPSIGMPKLNAPMLQMPQHGSSGDLRSVNMRPITSQGTYRPTMPNQPIFDDEMAKIAAGQLAATHSNGKPNLPNMPNIPNHGGVLAADAPRSFNPNTMGMGINGQSMSGPNGGVSVGMPSQRVGLDMGQGHIPGAPGMMDANVAPMGFSPNSMGIPPQGLRQMPGASCGMGMPSAMQASVTNMPMPMNASEAQQGGLPPMGTFDANVAPMGFSPDSMGIPPQGLRQTPGASGGMGMPPVLQAPVPNVPMSTNAPEVQQGGLPPMGTFDAHAVPMGGAPNLAEENRQESEVSSSNEGEASASSADWSADVAGDDEAQENAGDIADGEWLKRPSDDMDDGQSYADQKVSSEEYFSSDASDGGEENRDPEYVENTGVAFDSDLADEHVESVESVLEKGEFDAEEMDAGSDAFKPEKEEIGAGSDAPEPEKEEVDAESVESVPKNERVNIDGSIADSGVSDAASSGEQLRAVPRRNMRDNAVLGRAPRAAVGRNVVGLPGRGSAPGMHSSSSSSSSGYPAVQSPRTGRGMAPGRRASHYTPRASDSLNDGVMHALSGGFGSQEAIAATSNEGISEENNFSAMNIGNREAELEKDVAKNEDVSGLTPESSEFAKEPESLSSESKSEIVELEEENIDAYLPEIEPEDDADDGDNSGLCQRVEEGVMASQSDVLHSAKDAGHDWPVDGQSDAGGENLHISSDETPKDSESSANDDEAIRVLREQIEKLKKENLSISESAESLLAENTRLSDAKSELETEKENLKNELNLAQNKNAELNSNLNAMSEEADRHVEALKRDHEQELDTLRITHSAEMSEMESQQSALEARVRELEEALGEAQRALAEEKTREKTAEVDGACADFAPRWASRFNALLQYAKVFERAVDKLGVEATEPKTTEYVRSMADMIRFCAEDLNNAVNKR